MRIEKDQLIAGKPARESSLINRHQIKSVKLSVPAQRVFEDIVRRVA